MTRIMNQKIRVVRVIRVFFMSPEPYFSPDGYSRRTK